jgi:hypothetical protein
MTKEPNFLLWWREEGRIWIPRITISLIVIVGLLTGIIGWEIIALVALVVSFVGIFLLLWAVLLDS